MFQNQLFQYSGFDITAIALFSIFTMRRTYKVVRVLFRNTSHQAPEKPYRWNVRTIAVMLQRKEYIGCTVNFKTYTNSIWDKTQRLNPEENQLVFYNTHPAIVSQEVFDKVQELREKG